MNNTFTALEGVSVGHATDPEALTGCTVVVFDVPYPTGLYIHGQAPATHNTARLDPLSTDYYMNGLFVAGGSQDGVAATCESFSKALKKNSNLSNPSISGAGIFDLSVIAGKSYEVDAADAFRAASKEPVPAGNVGAGTGAAVGKFFYLNEGTEIAGMAGGVGHGYEEAGGARVFALSVVNALGNIVLPDGKILAGNRNGMGGFKTFRGLTRYVTKSNTIVSIVGTTAYLGQRTNLARMARMGAHGQIRAAEPSGTSLDGDAVFAFSTGEADEILGANGEAFTQGDWFNVRTDVIGDMAARAVRSSIYDACINAQTIPFAAALDGIIPSANDYHSIE